MRGYLCLLLLGLATAAYCAEAEGTENKDAAFAQNADKIKRGAVKISNADSPAFNHLTSSNSGSASTGSNGGGSSSGGSSSSTAGFKPILPSNVPPFRYLQSGQYQQHFLPFAYYQPSQSAAQIAAQYSFQGAPVAHYLQTPTQVQYVSAPSVSQVPFVKYQGFGGDYSAGRTTSDLSSATAGSSASSSSASSGSSQHLSHAQAVQTAAGSVQTTVQPKDFFLYQMTKPVYYTQQPLVFFVQPQAASAANFVYQQPGLNYYLRQQQPQQYLNFQPTSRFAMYPAHTNQLTYLVPMAVAQAQDATSGSDLKSSQKLHTGTQHTTSGSSFTYGNKG